MTKLKQLTIKLEDLLERKAIFKRTVYKECSCEETNSEDCPEHISYHIEATRKLIKKYV